MTTDERIQELENRLARLEEEFRQVQRRPVAEPAQPWWERTAGMFKDDKAFAEIVRLGQAARRADRERAKKTSAAARNGQRRRPKQKV
jgi:hypothetical protein